MTVFENRGLALRRRTVLASAAALFGLAGAAWAYEGYAPADLQVVDRETGRAPQVWRARGRLYVAGEPGDRYALRVTNRTGGRVQLVLSVDGVNVVTGETASYEQNGYVLDAYESYDVTGWRKSRAEVAAFAFAPLSQSYAARTGRPGDVGVIGMAVFRERIPEPPPPPQIVRPEARDGMDRAAPDSEVVVTGRRAAPATAMPAPPAQTAAQPAGEAKASARGMMERQDERLGTAHGARERSYVDYTSFERATAHPEMIRQIEYDTYAHLVASGVIPRPWRPPARPRPFPRDPDGGGFVPDPPG